MGMLQNMEFLEAYDTGSLFQQKNRHCFILSTGSIGYYH